MYAKIETTDVVVEIYRRDEMPEDSSYQSVSSTELQPFVCQNYRAGKLIGGRTLTAAEVAGMIAKSQKLGHAVTMRAASH